MAMTDTHVHGFDFFKWDAPYYETPEKVIAALYNANVQGKELERIHVPGVGTDRKGDRLDLGEKHPFCLWFNEPLQLIFRDGTTLEILLLYNGGARIGVNSLPIGVKSSVNQTTWDLKSLLSLTLFKSKVVQQKPFLLERAQRSSYNAESGVDKGYMTEKWTENTLRIVLNNDQVLELYTRDRERNPEQYRLRLLERGEVVQLPTQRWLAARNKGYSIELTPGPGPSGNFRFIPIYSRTPKKDTWSSRKGYLANYTLSMDVEDCIRCFGEIFHKHFDPAIRVKQWPDEEPRFDWYGSNLYSMAAADRMIAQIRQAADRMEKNPADPELWPFADRLWVTVLSNEEYYAGVDEAEERRRKILAAVDLYRRFARCLQSMLEAARRDGCDAIELYGP